MFRYRAAWAQPNWEGGSPCGQLAVLGIGLGTEGGWGYSCVHESQTQPHRGGGSASERALFYKPKFTFSAGTAPFKTAIQCIHGG